MGRSLIALGIFIGSFAGFLPSLWGDNDLFSPAGMLLSFVGCIAGAWAGYRIQQNLDM
jgi:hypothetical protein